VVAAPLSTIATMVSTGAPDFTELFGLQAAPPASAAVRQATSNRRKGAFIHVSLISGQSREDTRHVGAHRISDSIGWEFGGRLTFLDQTVTHAAQPGAVVGPQLTERRAS
jgi:hypothetical protein